MRRILPLVVALALFGAACSSSDTSADTVSAGDASASQEWPYRFITKTVDGSTLDTGDYAGQDIVLWFWAPW